MQRMLIFFGKVFPLLKNGQNKCPISIFPKNFRKKKQNIFPISEGKNWVPYFLTLSIATCSAYGLRLISRFVTHFLTLLIVREKRLVEII
jgi:hypothetical protein